MSVVSPGPHQHLTVNGVDLAFLEEGPADGPLALCLHGFPDHAPTWHHLLTELAGAGYRAVAPWLRGYSPSSLAPDGNYQVAALALDALALADELAGGRDAVLIGHDWGAIAAYTAVGHRPARFGRLVTMAVPHQAAMMARFLTSPEQLRRSWYVFVFQTPLAELAVVNDDYAFIDFLWRTWSPGSIPDPANLRAIKDMFATPGCIDAAISYYRFMLGTIPPDPALAEVAQAGTGPVTVPSLYLHGEDDGCMGVELADEADLQPWFPAGLEVALIPAAGHFLHLDQPDAVNRRVLDFLSS